MRLFVALNLPKKEKDRIYRAARVFRDSELPVRWVEPEKYHLTLKFLGDVSEDRVEVVEEAVGRVALTTGALDLAVEGFLQDRRSPVRISACGGARGGGSPRGGFASWGFLRGRVAGVVAAAR